MCEFTNGCPGHPTDDGYVPCASLETCASGVFVCVRQQNIYGDFIPCEGCVTEDICEINHIMSKPLRHTIDDEYPPLKLTDEEINAKYDLNLEDICDYCVAHQGYALKGTSRGERRINGACWRCGME